MVKNIGKVLILDVLNRRGMVFVPACEGAGYCQVSRKYDVFPQLLKARPAPSGFSNFFLYNALEPMKPFYSKMFRMVSYDKKVFDI